MWKYKRAAENAAVYAAVSLLYCMILNGHTDTSLHVRTLNSYALSLLFSGLLFASVGSPMSSSMVMCRYAERDAYDRFELKQALANTGIFFLTVMTVQIIFLGILDKRFFLPSYLYRNLCLFLYMCLVCRVWHLHKVEKRKKRLVILWIIWSVLYLGFILTEGVFATMFSPFSVLRSMDAGLFIWHMSLWSTIVFILWVNDRKTADITASWLKTAVVIPSWTLMMYLLILRPVFPGKTYLQLSDLIYMNFPAFEKYAYSKMNLTLIIPNILLFLVNILLQIRSFGADGSITRMYLHKLGRTKLLRRTLYQTGTEAGKLYTAMVLTVIAVSQMDRSSLTDTAGILVYVLRYSLIILLFVLWFQYTAVLNDGPLPADRLLGLYIALLITDMITGMHFISYSGNMLSEGIWLAVETLLGCTEIWYFQKRIQNCREFL
ncbi:MAG: hypothetical protein IKS37_02325 [Solobacterium sp.]|nr:hypothetical protein [Solobacterium sp.]